MLTRVYRALRRLLHPPATQQAMDAVIEALHRAAGPVGQQNVQLSDQLNLVLHELSLLTGRQLEFQRENRLLLGQLSLPPSESWAGRSWTPVESAAETMIFPRSTVCRQASFETPLFPFWMAQIGYAPRYHRKLWEFVFICQALFERGLIKPGMRGLGFGVGGEPLAAYFAGKGCLITGTDMEPDAAADAGWVETAQYSGGREALRRPNLCPDPVFDANVEFRFADMNAIPADLAGYDFCWSACAFEHLGSIEQGLTFVERSIDCLKPGGFAVHTTEYNLSSNHETIGEGGTVLFRRRDLESLAQRLAARGDVMAPLDLDPGVGQLDRYIDVAPYRDEPHLTLALMGYAATSVGIIVRKGP
jgi:hypothetical protein